MRPAWLRRSTGEVVDLHAHRDRRAAIELGAWWTVTLPDAIIDGTLTAESEQHGRTPGGDRSTWRESTMTTHDLGPASVTARRLSVDEYVTNAGWSITRAIPGAEPNGYTGGWNLYDAHGTHHGRFGLKRDAVRYIAHEDPAGITPEHPTPDGPTQQKWYGHGYQAALRDMVAALDRGEAAAARAWLAHDPVDI